MRIAIINSLGFWTLGWMTSPETQQIVIDALQRAGITVDIYEVQSKPTLERVIEQIKTQPHCLVWANAYTLKASQDSNKTLWLVDILEQHGLAVIGSGAQALADVLQKHHCQAILAEANVSIPKFTAITADALPQIDQILASNALEFPLFLKPNALSSSMGISQDCIIYDKTALHKKIIQMGQEHGYPLMLEEFLPGKDVTVAVFNVGDQQLMLATHYTADNHQSEHTVLDRTDRLQDWGGSKQMYLVTDPNILDQIPNVVLSACRALGILDVTRIDCRLDRHGQLKTFDVNGMPGLDYPDSVIVWQMITLLAEHSWSDAFDTLLYLIVYCAATRCEFEVPDKVKTIALQHLSVIQQANRI